ncbi:MAG: outer membrane lipoprotein carrier protein LolA, partial [Bacteroidales bacterium]
MKTKIYFLSLLFLSSCFLMQGEVANQSKGVKQTTQGVNDPKANAILQASKKWLTGLKSVKATFSYTLENKAQKIRQNKTGNILVSGNKFTLNFMGLNVFCNGQTLWSYNPSTKEVSISEYSDSEAGSMNPLSIVQQYEKNYRAKFIRDESIAGMDRAVIDLIPLKASSFHKMRMYITKTNKQIYKTAIYDKNGSIYTYTINKYILNPSVNANNFTF